MGKTAKYIALLIGLATVSSGAAASSFSDMSLAEVSAILQNAPAGGTTAATLSTKESVSNGSLPDNDPYAMPVNAYDLITKVFAVLDRPCSRMQCINGVDSIFKIVPRQEKSMLWLDSADGYLLSYSGMTPDVSAMANVADNDSIGEYCYFFLFPYSCTTRDAGTRAQADFSGALLQEMQDMDIGAGANVLTDDLFDVTADCEGRFVNVRLMDDRNSDGAGRYILMFIVRPEARSEADDIAAL